MNEHFFHVQPEAIAQKKFSLSKEEGLHFLKSLRGEIGEQIWLLDAKGIAYLALVKDTSNGVVSGEITKTFPNYGESPNDIHLILGLIKGRRMDVAIEKAVEFGVKSIQPIIFERCIKKKLNLNRLNKVVIAAAKQSGRSYFPNLSEPLSFLEWTRRRFEGTTLVCHYSSDSYIHDLEFQDLRSVNVIIGPEGDFSPKELTVFQELKIPNVKLSPRRLRSESACSAALNQINQAYQIQNG